MLMVVLTLVMIAVILTIYQIISGESDEPGTWLYIVGLIILILFFVELTLRMYTTLWCHGQLWTFLSQWLNWVDILVVSVDIVFLFLPTGGSEGGYIKTARLTRLVRLLRIFRAAKVVSELHKLIKRKVHVEWVEPLRYYHRIRILSILIVKR
jgi:Ion transport protein